MNVLYYPKFLVSSAKDSTGQTLLHVAVDGMNYSAAKSLIDMGIAEKLINTGDNFNMTPMHIAAINFDIEIFNLITKLHPDYSIKDKDGKTCLDYLRDNEDIDKGILSHLEDVKI